MKNDINLDAALLAVVTMPEKEIPKKSDSVANQNFDAHQRNLYLRGLSAEERKELIHTSLVNVYRLMVDPVKPRQRDQFSGEVINATFDLNELVQKCGKNEFDRNALSPDGSGITDASVTSAIVASQVREVKTAQGLERMMEALESVDAELPRLVLSASSHIAAPKDVKLMSTDGGLMWAWYPRYNRLFGAVIAQRLACIDGDSPFVEAVIQNKWSKEKLAKYIGELRGYSLGFKYPEEERNMLVKRFTSAEGIADFEARFKPGGKYPSLWEQFRF